MQGVKRCFSYFFLARPGPAASQIEMRPSVFGWIEMRGSVSDVARARVKVQALQIQSPGLFIVSMRLFVVLLTQNITQWSVNQTRYCMSRCFIVLPDDPVS